jgi:enoyl-CoA hydratase/carnithine racemase
MRIMSDIRTESANRVLSIILDRPAKKNAITDAMYGDIAAALARAADDPETGAVLIRGEGPDFCAGNDISMFAAAAAGEQNILASNIGPFLEAISTFPKPLVAAVSGQAIGIGVTMLLHCDLVYIAGDAELRTPFIDLGLVPEAASALMLPERIGHVRSFALFALAETLSGAEAATIGIANRALPADEVERAAELAARTLASKPLSALVATKALMRNAEAIAAALDADQKAFAAQIQTPEAAAAFAAFAARKGPPAS